MQLDLKISQKAAQYVWTHMHTVPLIPSTVKQKCVVICSVRDSCQPPRLRSEMDSAVTVKSLRGHRAGPWTDNLDCPSFDVWFY